MHLMIPKDLAQEVLNYLAQRPYIDVHQMIQALQSIQPVGHVEGLRDDLLKSREASWDEAK